MEKIINRVKELRNEKGLSQEELATAIGCDKQTIYRYENLKSVIDTTNLTKLSSYFNVTTDYLLCLSDIKNNNSECDNYENIASIILQKHNFTDEPYYVIFRCGNSIGAQTIWKGYTKNHKEIRTLREYSAYNAIRLCIMAYGRPIIIETQKDIDFFLSLNNPSAVVSASNCKKYLPNYLEPFIV